jgi:hypothetical protein
MNIPLDAAILPVQMLSAQKQNLVISQTPDKTPELYTCAVTTRKCAKSTAPHRKFSLSKSVEKFWRFLAHV